MYRILLVEDDSALAAEIAKLIENYGNEARVATDFRDVISEFDRVKPDLVLMDVKLPFRDGYYWTAKIREKSSVPIIFVSSASDSMNIVMAINMGGDDFIAKPFDPMVLNAKIQAVLRRAYSLSESAALQFHGASLNTNDGSVTYDGKTAELTKNELRILQTLLENRGKIISRNALMLRLWNSDCFVEENTLTVNVNRLRKKLAELGLCDVILTKHGSGYIIQ